MKPRRLKTLLDPWLFDFGALHTIFFIGPFQSHVITLIAHVAKKMSSPSKAAKLVPKLHAVTLIRSGIGRPYWQKRTLKALKLTKMHKTVIHKNTPSMNGQLASVKELIKVEPVVIRTDLDKSPSRGEFFQDNAHFFIKT